MEIIEHDLMTTAQAAEVLGVTSAMVLHLVNNGVLLPALRTPSQVLVERRKVDALLEARRASGLKCPGAPNRNGRGRPRKRR